MKYFFLFITIFSQLSANQKNSWQDFNDGQLFIENQLQKQVNKNKAKNVIVIIGDGYGITTNYINRLNQGQKNGGLGDEFILPHEKLDHLALIKTYTTNGQTPDSAGTSTAIHSGFKTKSGLIGLSNNSKRGDCTSERKELESIMDVFKQLGKSVGLVTNTRVTHATPAAVYAHSFDRNWEDDSKVPEDCLQDDIALQLINSNIDLVLGGGRRHFLPIEVLNQKGKRKDSRNLIEEFKTNGGVFLNDNQDFKNYKIDTKRRLIGLFSDSHFPYLAEKENKPSLLELSNLAIEYLNRNKKGFYLLIEAGRIDHGHHAGKLNYVLKQTQQFNNLIQNVLAKVNLKETLLIVTADHAHSLGINGYCGRGSKINGICYRINPNDSKHQNKPNLGLDGKPFSVVNYLNGPGSIFEKKYFFYYANRKRLSDFDYDEIEFDHEALIPTFKESHSGLDVVAYASGPSSYLLNGTIEQNFLFHIINHAVGNSNINQ